MSSLGLSYQKFEHSGRGCSCRTLSYFPSYLPGFNHAAKSSLSNNRTCAGSIQLLVSSVRRTRAPVNLPTAQGKVKEGGRHLWKVTSLSLTCLFTATWKKDPSAWSWLGELLLGRKIMTLVCVAHIKGFLCTDLRDNICKIPFYEVSIIIF